MSREEKHDGAHTTSMLQILNCLMGSDAPAGCSDDHSQMIALASCAGVTIDSCADVLAFCEHSVYGSTVQATCPATCGSCTGSDRRLADGKAPNAEKTEESSSSDTKILYP